MLVSFFGISRGCGMFLPRGDRDRDDRSCVDARSSAISGEGTVVIGANEDVEIETDAEVVDVVEDDEDDVIDEEGKEVSGALRTGFGKSSNGDNESCG